MPSSPLRVALLQFSYGFGGSEMRMAKYALELAREGSVRPVLIINEKLNSEYNAREPIRRAFSEEKIEIRIVNSYSARLIKRILFFKFSKIKYAQFALNLAGNFLLKWAMKKNPLVKLVDDVHVVHGFYGPVSFAAFLALRERFSGLMLHEVTSHRVAPKYARMLSENLKDGMRPVYLKCVSSTVQSVLMSSIEKFSPRMLEKKKIEISASSGPFIGTVEAPEGQSKKSSKPRRVVFGHRLQPAKNGKLFAKAALEIMQREKYKEWSFLIFGRGEEESQIKEILKEAISKNRASVSWSNNLELELKKSSVFVSIIETGNYPSQAVFEALAHGNLICASNTGVTKEKFGSPPGVFFYCSTTVDSVIEAISSAIDAVEMKGFEASEAASFNHYINLRKQSGYFEEMLGKYLNEHKESSWL